MISFLTDLPKCKDEQSAVGKLEALNHSCPSVQNPADPCQIRFVSNHQAVTQEENHH